MNNFDYIRPTTIAEAVAAASQPGAAYLAGGTNLLDLMKGGISRPARLVDITRLPGLDAIEMLPDGSLRIGALVRNADLAHRSPTSRALIPLSPRRCCPAHRRSCATPRRSAATCCSGRAAPISTTSPSACNKRQPGSGCDARDGDNRLHAVLGWSESCIATNPSDFCVPLVALDAVVEIAGPPAAAGEIPLEDFHRLPGDASGARDRARTRRADRRRPPPGEAAGFAANARYLKVRERTSYAFAVVSAAAALRLDGRRDRGGADRARRRRSEALAREGGRSGAPGPADRRPELPHGGRDRARATRRPPATTPSRSSWRAAS